MPGLPAARVTDPTEHQGFITSGAPSVLIGRLPAARLGDTHSCPQTYGSSQPHVGGTIIEGSATVLIGGRAAARETDKCTCLGAPVVASPLPEWVRQLQESGEQHPIPVSGPAHREAALDTDGDGEVDTHHASGELLSADSGGHTNVGPAEVGVINEGRLGYYDAEHTERNDRSSVEGEVGIARLDQGFWVGPAGDNGRTPYFRHRQTTRVLGADGHADDHRGDGGGAGVGLTGITETEEITVTIPNPLDPHHNLQWVASGSAGASAGPSGGAHIYRDDQQGRSHLGGSGDLGPVGISIDVSYGREYGPTSAKQASLPKRAPINQVAQGCANVLIG